MAAMKITNLQQQQQQQQQSSPPSSCQQQAILQQQHSIDSISSIHSNDSNQQTQQIQQQQQQHSHPNNNQTPLHHQQHPTTTQRSHSSSSMTPSLHSHPSIDSTVATPPIGQTPTHSSGSSTPQNHYSPLLNNSMSSTAAGTPSGSSIASGALSMSGGNTGGGGIGGGSGNNSFIYNVCSPTPPLSANSSQASDILKITENDGTGVQQQQQQQQTHHQQTPPTNNNINCSISSESSIAQPQPFNAYPNSSSCSGNTQEISTSNSADQSDAASGTVVENDERSRASVLQKASMFEKQAAAAVKNTPTTSSSSSASGSGSGSGSAVAAIGGGARHSPVVLDNVGIYGTRTNQAQPIDPQEVGKFWQMLLALTVSIDLSIYIHTFTTIYMASHKYIHISIPIVFIR